jgi:transposase InsO family protein
VTVGAGSGCDEPLTDRSSRPHSTSSTDVNTRRRIVKLRKQRLTVRQIAKVVGVSVSTAARVCRVAGLSRLKQPDAPPPPIRYECERPGELLHVDIKRLGRFDRPGHRVTRRRSYGSPKQGFEFLHVATDDASRATYAEILPDECATSAVTFLCNAVAWFARVGVTVERVMTDNGSAYVSDRLRALCNDLKVRHKRIRPHRPQTKARSNE